MPLSHQEAVAALHVLVAVAQADGKLHAQERAALEVAIRDAGLGDLVNAQELFDDAFDLSSQVALLQSEEGRDAAFRAAYSLAWADGACGAEEQRLLGELALELSITRDREGEIRRIFEDLHADRAARPSYAKHIDDPAERSLAVRHATTKCAIISAVIGAFPFPGFSIVTDLAVLYLQIELVRDIATMHGQAIDKPRARALLTAVGVGTTARLAISNLAKLLPGWGSVVGATTSFASSYGVGMAFDKHFAGGLDEVALAQAFEAARAEGKREYAAKQDEIEAKSQRVHAELGRLTEARRAGDITASELHERVHGI